MKLKETHPDKAKRRFLEEKRTHLTSKSVYNYTTTLDQFTEWLSSKEVYDMTDVDSDLIDQFKSYRLDEVKPITARNDLRTIKNFIEACESYQCVPTGLHELVKPPKVPEGDEINDTILTREEAEHILEHLNKFKYATARHTVFLILWKTGMRIGGLRALDVGDFIRSKPVLEVRHRPDTETPLKKKPKGERDINITESMATVIQDYVDNSRASVRDDHGRKPLIATPHGRMSRTTITRHIYRSTSPCTYLGQCPVSVEDGLEEPVEDPDECDHNEWNASYGCPASVSPHALRRGYVTAARNAGQPKEITGERVNMSGDVLDKHYDHASHDEKADRRKDMLEDI